MVVWNYALCIDISLELVFFYGYIMQLQSKRIGLTKLETMCDILKKNVGDLLQLVLSIAMY